MARVSSESITWNLSKISGLSELPNQTACCLKSPGDISASSGESTLPSTKEEERQWSGGRGPLPGTPTSCRTAVPRYVYSPSLPLNHVCTGMVQRRKVMLHTWGLRISWSFRVSNDLITKLKSLYSLSKHKHENKINTPNSLALAGQEGAPDGEPANVSSCT